MWRLSNPQAAKRLRQVFARLDIPDEGPGFCDHPAFLSAEASHPELMELYAQYVEAREYSADYLTDAARKIGIAAAAVEAAVAKDGRLGACVDASGMLGRMLDRLGVWNYVAKATLTVEFPASSGLNPRYFWALDTREFVAPHAVVVAPPFGVIDVTAKHQPYPGGVAALLPAIVLADQWDSCGWYPEDLISPSVQVQIRRAGETFHGFLAAECPDMLQLISRLPPRQIHHDGTSLRYVMVAVGGTVEQLEGITGYKPCNRSALQIFEQDVMPLCAQ
ncbi:hypothetical protein OIN59_17410 [Acidovorax sp. D2M1]|uniref:Uncharacterized protein n=1 Tax=Acidovorax benzenivorans TaxID=2987520 RepID=A0ABT5RZU1_9BURK|nr:hypothetical protein [Acidovorax benzenivorans]MDD2179218.1 hypothetical protein [Acidovorax benzenivorans]